MFLAPVYFSASTQTVLQAFSTAVASEVKPAPLEPSRWQVPKKWVTQNKRADASSTLPLQLQQASQCFNVKKIVSLDVKNKTGTFRGTVLNCAFSKNSLVVGQDVPGQQETRFFYHLTLNGYERKNELSAMSTFFTEKPEVIAVIHDKYADQAYNGQECTYTLPAQGTDPNLITLANSLKDCQPIREETV